MADLSRIFLCRITHIENIPHVIRMGITYARSVNRNPDFITRLQIARPRSAGPAIFNRDRRFLIADNYAIANRASRVVYQ